MMTKFMLALAAALVLAGHAHAQPYPTKPIRFILPFPTGSATDQIARIVGKEMSDTLGQPIVVENKPGAGGAIAAEFVAKSPPDGYTLFIGSNTSWRRIRACSRRSPTTRQGLRTRRADDDAAERVSRSSRFPGKEHRRAGGAGEGEPEEALGRLRRSSAQVAIAQLESLGGFEALEVPYKGMPLAVMDVIGGTVDFTVGDMGTAIAQVKGGKVKSLGVTSEKRNPLVPDWPTVAETYPGFDVIGWHTIVAPANTPRDIRNKLYEAAAKALAKKEVIDALAGMGVTPAS
jgi:tripartite-type tricarboxylate transporter receptor subunit TctC